jgi:hypothetical protein
MSEHLKKALELEQNPVGDFYYVVCTNMMFFDPAIDTTEPLPSTEEPPDENAPLFGMAMVERYRTTRMLSDLRFRPDVAPTLFRMKRLTPQFTSSTEGMGYEEQQLLTVRAACTQIILPTGQLMEATWPRKPEIQRGQNLCDESWIQRIVDEFGISTVLEIGPIAFQKARMRKGARGPFLCQVGLPQEPFQTR